MKRPLVFLGVLTLAATAAACSSDPNKNANDAHDAQLAAQRKAEDQTADAQRDQTLDEAKIDRKSTVAEAAHSDRATKNGVEADAKMTEARQDASAKAVDRLKKADAKTEELRALINRAGAKATTQSRDALRAVDDQRAAAESSVNWLSHSTDGDFLDAKQAADTQLDTLEGYVERAAAEVDKFK